MKKINFKKGSASAFLGIFLGMLCFLLAIWILNCFNLFTSSVIAQTRTDAIADAVAEAGTNNTGIVDQSKMNDVKSKMIQYNFGSNSRLNQSGIRIQSLTWDSYKLLHGDRAEHITTPVLDMTATIEWPVIASKYLPNFNTSTLTYNYHNKTKMMLLPHTSFTERFPTTVDENTTIRPWDTIDSAENLDKDTYYRIVTQFAPYTNDRYKPTGIDTREDVLLWDITKTLHCELPYYYYEYDGSPYDSEHPRIANLTNSDGLFVTDSNGIDLDNPSILPITSSFTETRYVNHKTQRTANSEGNHIGYYDFACKYLPNVRQNLQNPPSEPDGSYEGFEKWQLLSENDASEEKINAIKESVNRGNPTFLLYKNGAIEVVLPTLEGSRINNDQLFVMFAADSFTSINSHTTGGTDVKTPYGNFIAITYNAHSDTVN